MHIFRISFFSIFFCCLGVSLMHADTTSTQALGNAGLVIDDETTTLSLFNLGNPAGAALLPKKNRIDTTLNYLQIIREEKFTTASENVRYYYPDGNTLDADGNTIAPRALYPNLDAAGNTLPPNTVFGHSVLTRSGGLNALASPGYAGYLAWLSDNTILQLIPEAHYTSTTSDKNNQTASDLQGNGRIRGAWLATPNLSLGAGLQVSGDQEKNWDGRSIANYFNTHSAAGALFTGEIEHTSSQLGFEAGTILRLNQLLDPEDTFDCGLLFKGVQSSAHNVLQPIAAATSSLDGKYSLLQSPWELTFQSLYSYKSLMDIHFLLGYQTTQEHVLWSSSLADANQLDQDYLSAKLHNIDYELGIRVRVPMVEEDDLRFGVVFNNYGVGHPLPTGELQTLSLTTMELGSTIKTASSGIGIGTAFVPSEGSIIAFEYHLGSSKSRNVSDSENILVNTGYNGLVFGAQYQVLEGFFLRAGVTNTLLSYDLPSRFPLSSTKKETNSFVTNNTSLRFGVGVEHGPWQINLTGMWEHVTHSPFGWTIEDKPADLATINIDKTERFSGQLGLTLTL